MNTTTKTYGQVWRRVRHHSEPPEPGTIHKIRPRKLLRHNGESCGSAALDDSVKARVIKVGAHWSDQPGGQSGHFVLYELLEQATDAGEPVSPEDLE